jgi:hypothetical protein
MGNTAATAEPEKSTVQGKGKSRPVPAKEIQKSPPSPAAGAGAKKAMPMEETAILGSSKSSELASPVNSSGSEAVGILQQQKNGDPFFSEFLGESSPSPSSVAPKISPKKPAVSRSASEKFQVSPKPASISTSPPPPKTQPGLFTHFSSSSSEHKLTFSLRIAQEEELSPSASSSFAPELSASDLTRREDQEKEEENTILSSPPASDEAAHLRVIQHHGTEAINEARTQQNGMAEHGPGFDLEIPQFDDLLIHCLFILLMA